MSDPWMKWYPSDWRSDPCLRCCSLAARGLWVEMLCIMHESPRRGHLLVGNSAPTLRQLASISGSTLKETKRLLAELLAAGVYSVQDGIIFSRRMVRDEEKRAVDKENGSKGGNPKLKGGVNPQDKAQIPEARGQRPEKKIHTAQNAVARDEKFEEAWELYPKREGGNPKAPAAKLFLRWVKSGDDPQTIIDGIKRFAIAEQRTVGTPFIPQMRKWLSDRRWLDYGPDCSIVKFDVRKHLI